MKIRMIGAIREVQLKDPLCGLWLAPVAFPMEVTNYGAAEPNDPDTVTLHDEEELKAWAAAAFPDGYEIMEVEVPAAAVPNLEDREQVRRRELAEALVSLSTAYDEPHATVLEALEEARLAIRAAWRGDDVSVDDFALAHGKLDGLVSAARQRPT